LNTTLTLIVIGGSLELLGIIGAARAVAADFRASFDVMRADFSSRSDATMMILDLREARLRRSATPHQREIHADDLVRRLDRLEDLFEKYVEATEHGIDERDWSQARLLRGQLRSGALGAMTLLAGVVVSTVANVLSMANR
jgi:hypothetical protein